MPGGGNLSLIVSDIFHISKYDTNEADREQKTLRKINQRQPCCLYTTLRNFLSVVKLGVLKMQTYFNKFIPTCLSNSGLKSFSNTIIHPLRCLEVYHESQFIIPITLISQKYVFLNIITVFFCIFRHMFEMWQEIKIYSERKENIKRECSEITTV